MNTLMNDYEADTINVISFDIVYDDLYALTIQNLSSLNLN